MKLYLITGNLDKVRAAQTVFDEYGIQLELLRVDEPEIQAATSLEVSKFTALKISKKYNLPVIREDHSLYFNGFLGGCFPGPYTSYFDKRVPVEEFIKSIYVEKTDSLIDGYFEVGCCYADGEGNVIESSYRIDIEISNEIRGDRGNLDKILMIKGSGKTFAECVPGENTKYRLQNYHFIAKQLKNVK